MSSCALRVSTSKIFGSRILTLIGDDAIARAKRCQALWQHNDRGCGMFHVCCGGVKFLNLFFDTFYLDYRDSVSIGTIGQRWSGPGVRLASHTVKLSAHLRPRPQNSTKHKTKHEDHGQIHIIIISIGNPILL